MIEFLAGACTLAFAVAAAYFLRFWRKTGDRLFASFALAFLLMALNQLAVAAFEASDERSGYSYVLRVLGFVLILYAIVDKNTRSRREGRRAG
jgi:membrane associated rhomboid family serine protease